ncbi:MAG: hypothetical protein LIO37_02610, partial [Clostridiales bacterium]|nr:hypothetical protein [Clostridiales bacterium]
MSTKKELVLRAFHNVETERVPVGFWFHFLNPENFFGGLANPDLLEQNLAGQKAYKEAFDPDFVKIMTDGYFLIPVELPEIKSASDLRNIKPVAKDHPIYEKYVELVSRVHELYGDDILKFVNIFSPLYHLLLLQQTPQAEWNVNDWLAEDPEAVAYALDVIADALSELVSKVVGQGLADGIYLSTKNTNRTISADTYTKYIAPSEIKVLEAANAIAPDHILHICGYEGNQNILEVYVDYPVTAVNVALHTEDVTLSEAKELFKGRAIIGGFDNTTKSVLYKGTKEEIQAETKKILAESGRTGVILGADCT